MMKLSEKSIKVLELEKVLEMLANQAISDVAKETAMSLKPNSSIETVERWLDETNAAVKLIGTKGSPSFSGICDITDSLKRAEIGGILNNRELLNIGSLLSRVRTIKSYASEDGGEKTVLTEMFDSLNGNKHLEDKIYNAIKSEEEISDNASAELASIRRHIRSANQKVRDTLQKIVSSPSYSKSLQEPIVTMRQNRYVVPVKSEFKGNIPGLIHDVSSSGATVFVEPMQVVQLNNELKELAAKEKREIERILADLSADCSNHSETILNDFDTMCKLDLIFAKAKLSYKLNCSRPDINLKGTLILKRARHPLLDQKTAVPIDFSLGEKFDTLIITGPNTGGKTVSLKTAGLLVLMTECGLNVPCDFGSNICLFSNVFADIGDEQSIEQSLSTFSSHMVNIVEILDNLDSKSLVLFDELGAGTDPVEGAAIAIAIIEEARKIGAKVAATTHYSELKTYALSGVGVENASCEFDVESLKPTYRLIIGIPGKSNAFAISERLGLNKNIIDNAQKKIDRQDQVLEDVITKLESKRYELESEQLNVRQIKLQLEDEARKASDLRKILEKEREKIQDSARAEAQSIIKQAKLAAENTFKELDEMKKNSGKSWQEINDARANLKHMLNEEANKVGQKTEIEGREKLKGPVRVGDTVKIAGSSTRAVVISEPDSEGNLRLRAGIMQIRAHIDELMPDDGKQETTKKNYAHKPQQEFKTKSAKTSVDIRGMNAEEAIMEVNQFIDSAVVSNLNTVTIIHGKGTGVLRTKIQNELKTHRAVKSFRNGLYGEGEHGVTVVELK